MIRTITLLIIIFLLFTGCKRDEKSTHKYFAERSVDTGKPRGLILSAYKTTMIANGKDETLIRAFVVDSAGREITSAELLKAGVEGVREVDPSIIIMMHVALGGQNDESVFWFDNMIARGVEFDIIGLSYYPQYHCTLDDLAFNASDLAERYNKDINVVEYSTVKEEIHEIVFGLPDNRGEGTFSWEP